MKYTRYARKYLRHLTAIFLLLTIVPGCEKTGYELLDPQSAGIWTLYNTGTGLPSNQIRDISGDKAGNLWVNFAGSGTASLDDETWTYYRTTNSDILSNAVTALGAAPDGTMIIGTTNGLSFISSSGVWDSYKDPAVSTMYINCIKVDSKGWIWVGTENQGFYVDSGTGFEQIYVSLFANVNAIEEDDAGNVFVGTDNGLLKWDGAGWSVLTTTEGLAANGVTALKLDSRDRLWIGTSGGLTVSYILRSVVYNLSLMNGTSGTFVRDIYEDRRGHIWFATWFDGLIRYDGVISHSYKVYNGFFEDDVNCIGEDSKGNMWFGLYSNGLVKYTLPLE